MQIPKVLGAVAAVLALLAIGASTASAAAFQAAEYTAELKGQQEGSHVLTAEGGLSITCTTVSMSGEMTKASETIELTPTYSGCTASGLSATVATEGCKFRFDANASDMDIVCPGTNAILVKAVTCEAKIGSQNGITTVTNSNSKGPPEAVSINASLKGIKYNKVKDGLFCPFSGTGEKEDGGLTGTTLLSAFVSGEPDPLIVGATIVTKLCQAAIVEPCKAVYKKNTVLEGTGIANAVIEYRIGGVPKKAECTTSSFKTTTSAEEGTPSLPASTSSLAFGLPNVCFGCTIAMENLSYKTYVTASTAIPGTGGFEMTQQSTTPPRVRIANCFGETCVYEAGALVGELQGGEPAKLVFTKTKFGQLNKGMSGANCEAPAEFTNTYQLSEPKVGGTPKVWVSNG